MFNTLTTRKPGMRRPGMRPGTRPRMRPRTYLNPPFKNLYQVGQKIIHHGQFGKTYRCKRKKDKMIYLVKCISKCIMYRLDRNPQRRNALLIAMQGEIDIMRRLRHKYIVCSEDCHEDKHTLYIVLGECKGGTLFDRVIQKQRYTETETKPIMKQIFQALFYLHEYHRLVHCDLRPNNILFANNTAGSRIKITDFGMSKILPRLRYIQKISDNMYYSAPEIIKGDYSHGCDMWSVGCIMFFMLFGHPPFYLHNDCNRYFGQMENKKISQMILKGYSTQTLHAVDVNRELLIFGFIREEQNILNCSHGNNTFYNIAPLIVHLIILFCNDPISGEAYHLMDSCLESDGYKRLTAKEALMHSWCRDRHKNEQKDVDIMYTYSMEETKHRHTYFGTMSLFRYAISGFFEDNFSKLKPKHFRMLKEIFVNMDLNDEGIIDYCQLKAGLLRLEGLNLSEKDIDKWFVELDVGRVGQIYFDELLNALVHDYVTAVDGRLYEAFRELDNDEDGKIKVEELKVKVKELNVYENVDEILNLIEENDLNNNGCIDYEEFLRCLHPDFNETPKWFK